ncbi:hypothetical protein [uncultured Desulfobacter sp.]|uniref:hypothetical protein n=1 Tax=uncultured Desulfobacter sp. TaxID=240139 RepID=UPI002AA77F64|nr:hypothetical protein [uncultured Desulfobacter sp.]
MTTDLLNPVLSELKNINFFEGRLLTGRDLQEQEAANFLQHWQLGRILGSGIAEGLEVYIEKDGSDGTPPVLKVMKGLAINGKGQVLELAKDYTMVRLARELYIPDPPDSYFKECVPPTTSVVPNGAGLYMFVMSPAKAYEDFAPRTGLQTDGALSDCGRRYIVDGIQFRLVEFNPTTLSGIPDNIVTDLEDLLTGKNPAKKSEPIRLSKLRNIAAHLCFGTQALNRLTTDIITANNGGLDKIENNALEELSGLGLFSECDVPLAFLYWTLDGLAFCDLWSVRRPVVFPQKIIHPQRNNIYQAVRQFHDQFYSISNIETIEISDYFRFLPPWGQIPVKEPQYNSSSGIELKRLFGSKYNRLPSVIGAGEFSMLQEASLNQNARHINDIDRIEVFYIAENIKALFEGTEQQLIGFFTFKEINISYCSSINVIRDSAVLNKSSFIALFDFSYQAYHDFRKIILLFALSAETQLTRQDFLGLEFIDQTLSTISGILSGLTSGCMKNHELWLNFKRFADQEKKFVNAWIDIVLAQEDGERYLDEIYDLMVEIKSLIESDMFEGFRGLLKSLNDHDLFAAYLAQQKINQHFVREIGVGPRGVISINYSISPVIPEEENGNTDILEPGEILFGFTLNARVDREATFYLKPRIEAFGWDVDLWDEENQQPRVSEHITMPKSNHLPHGESSDIFVKVKIMDLGETTAELIFDVEEVSGAGGVPMASDTVTLEMGMEIPRPDNRVLVILDTYGNAIPRENGIAIERDNDSVVQFVIRVTVPGHFTANVAPADGSAWTTLELSSTEFEAPEGTSSDTPYNKVAAALVNPGAAAKNTELIFTVSSESQDIDLPIEERFRLSVYID